MFKKRSLWSLLCGFGLLAPIQAITGKPNIVLILVDDWAWYGSPIAMDDSVENSRMPALSMPHLEQLAKEGMKFSNAYSGAPQCSPSRVCIQTGQSTARSGFTVFLGTTKDDYYDTRKTYADNPLVPNISDSEIDPDTLTIPELLKPLGYVSAHVGKWHMGGDPAAEGYEIHDGNTNNDPGNTLEDKSKPGDVKDPKLMFSVTQKSIAFMEDQVRKQQPFYLQISHYAMHEGRESTTATREKYAEHPLVKEAYANMGKSKEDVKRKDDPAGWLAMGEDLDTCIGRVLNKLKELNIDENTYVVVTSDNGYRHKFLPGLKQPFHGAKWWAWQGGLRIPMIVRGPNIKADSDFRENVIHYDFLPTFYEWAGGNPAELKNIDGKSLAGFMEGKQVDDNFSHRELYFHYPHYRTSMPHSAVVSGQAKVMHFYEAPQTPMLFDLEQDRGEVHNIADKNPEKHRALHEKMMTYLKEVGGRMPKINESYHPKTKSGEKNKNDWGPFRGSRSLEEDE